MTAPTTEDVRGDLLDTVMVVVAGPEVADAVSTLARSFRDRRGWAVLSMCCAWVWPWTWWSATSTQYPPHSIDSEPSRRLQGLPDRKQA